MDCGRGCHDRVAGPIEGGGPLADGKDSDTYDADNFKGEG